MPYKATVPKSGALLPKDQMTPFLPSSSSSLYRSTLQQKEWTRNVTTTSFCCLHAALALLLSSICSLLCKLLEIGTSCSCICTHANPSTAPLSSCKERDYQDKMKYGREEPSLFIPQRTQWQWRISVEASHCIPTHRPEGAGLLFLSPVTSIKCFHVKMSTRFFFF